jgi:hypothetical protein
MKTQESNYLFSFQDGQGNEIESKVIACYSKKEAMKLANRFLAESRDGDLVKVKTRKQ